MKIKKLLLIALTSVLLTGCSFKFPFFNKKSSESSQVQYFKVSYKQSSDYSVTGLKSEYKEGDKVSFKVNVLNISKALSDVKRDATSLSPDSSGSYDFTMPNKNVTLNIVLRDIDGSFNFEQIPYTLKPGINRSELKGAPWLNTNLPYMAEKIEKPSLKDDFYTSINYEDLVVNNPGYMDMSDDAVDSVFNDLFYYSSGISNARLFYSASELVGDGANSEVSNYLNNLDFYNFFHSKDLFSSRHSFFQIDKDSYNNYYVNFVDGYYYGEVNMSTLSLITGYESAFKSPLMDRLYSSFSLSISYSEKTSLNNFDLDTVYAAYYQYNYNGGLNWTPYSWSTSLNDALTDFGLTNSNNVYISNGALAALPYFDSYNTTTIKNSLITRLAFEFRFLTGIVNYRPISQIVASTGLWYNEQDISKTEYEKACRTMVRLMMSAAFEKSYLEVAGNATTKAKVSDVIEQVIAGYKATAATYDWLDETTRQGLNRKLNNMQYLSCYSDKVKNYPAMDQTNANSLTLFQIYQRYQKWLTNLYVTATVEDDFIWSMMASYTVNAFYYPSRNEFVILNGLLGGYPMTGSIEEILGSIGVVIGHEISHSIDENGAKYDENGQANNWWSDKCKESFTQKVTKMKSFYNQINLFDGNYVNGSIVNTEATADMGGMHIMLEIAKTIDGFDYDLFFRSYAKLWLSRAYSDAYIERMLTNEHPFAYLRVNVTIAQFEEFFETYDIGPGDRMYIPPEQRVAIW